jgi:two-component system, NarL family, response regulator NreC
MSAPAGDQVTRAERADRDQITIVIADDHTVVRQGLRLLIDNEDGLQVLAEAGSVPNAERLTRAYRPSVLILDLKMPGGSSLEAIPRLRADAPGMAIVVLTRGARLRAQGGPPTRSCSGRFASPRRAAATSTRASVHGSPPSGRPRTARSTTSTCPRSKEQPLCDLRVGVPEGDQHKLRRTSRAELDRYALDHGLVEI